MHIDLSKTTPGSNFRSEVCVVGAGIAGLILATRLARQGIAVHLLEAGGLELEALSQALYRTEMVFSTHRGATEGRFRMFGGSSTRWGGQILPFTSDILDPPAGSLTAAWPIEENEIARYYPAVEAILGVDPLPFSADLARAIAKPSPPPSADILVRFSKWAPFSKRNLAHTVGAEALAHRELTVFTHANVTSLLAATSGERICVANVLNYALEPFTFAASIFVICTGTIESSRLLLSSKDVPNRHDQIGRYFHDHLAYHAARFISPSREEVLQWSGPFYVAGTTHSCKLEASIATRVRERLLAVMAHVVVIEPEDSGTAALRGLLRALQQGSFKKAFGQHSVAAFRGSGDLIRLFLDSRFKKRRAVSKKADVYLSIDVEQAPNPENRIVLSNTEDGLGIPIAAIRWQVGEPEKDTAARYARIVRDYLSSAGITSLEWDPSVKGQGPPPLADTYHMMGGLRTGNDQTVSVVDRQLAVHDLDNLYVASCAVFPSGGSSNPTFTLMALTLRLADHIAGKLGYRVPDASPRGKDCQVSHSRVDAELLTRRDRTGTPGWPGRCLGCALRSSSTPQPRIDLSRATRSSVLPPEKHRDRLNRVFVAVFAANYAN